MNVKDRLTAHNKAGQGIINMDGVSDVLEASARIRTFSPLIISKLTEYEDTGLSPNEIERLKSENAALRERFLPCKVGDYVYDIANGTAYKTRVLEWRIFDNGHIACRTISSFPSLEEFGTRIFLKKEAAEARLAELKGEQL